MARKIVVFILLAGGGVAHNHLFSFFKMVELQIDYGPSSSHQSYTLKSVICWISKNLNNEFLFFHRDLDIRESMVMESLSKGFLLI